MPRTTMLDLAKINGSQQVIGLIEEAIGAAPEFETIPSITIAGTSYPTVIRTDLPSVGFRSPNQGRAASKSKFAKKLVECFIVSGRVEVDKAIADAQEDGPEALQAIEAAGVMEAGLRAIGTQLYYGISADATGFPGLQAMVHDDLAVDAGGSTAKTSVYAARLGARDIQLVFGKNTPFALSPFREETLYDADGNPFPGYVADLSAWAGLQCVNKYAAGRIKNIGTDTGKGLTDALVAELLSKWQGPAPDVLCMNKRSRYQLQTSRSVTIMSGPSQKVAGSIGSIAPTPTESNGIPIVVTDQLVNTES